MKTIPEAAVAVFAALLASVLNVAAGPRDRSGESETVAATEDSQGYAAVSKASDPPPHVLRCGLP